MEDRRIQRVLLASRSSRLTKPGPLEPTRDSGAFLQATEAKALGWEATPPCTSALPMPSRAASGNELWHTTQSTRRVEHTATSMLGLQDCRIAKERDLWTDPA
jgi:hypothetical protein